MKWFRSLLSIVVVLFMTTNGKLIGAEVTTSRDIHYYSSNYPTLTSAVSAIGIKSATLLIDDQQHVTNNLHIPANIELKFMRSGNLQLLNQSKVEIRGLLDAGPYQIFTGAGKVNITSKTLQKVYPQWWGAKADGNSDDTEAIKCAIDSGIGRIVDFPGGTYITGPILLKSNSTINLSPGTVLKAKNGYKPIESLLVMVNATNITIYGNHATVQMNKNEYVTGEWRHCVKILSSNNITINDLHCIDSGGDGFNIGSNDNKIPSKNVYLNNCQADNNRRQGLSIESGININIIGGRYANSNGTDPSFGIDLEPNAATDYLQNINIIGVLTEGNLKGGIQVVPAQLSGGLNPISINIINCTSKNDGWLGGLRLTYPPSMFNGKIHGEINVNNMTIISPNGRGVFVSMWPEANSPKAILRNIKVINPFSKPTLTPQGMYDKVGFVVYVNNSDPLAGIGNLDFIDCSADDTRQTPMMVVPFAFHTESASKPITNVKVINPGGSNWTQATTGHVQWNLGNGVVRYDYPPVKNFVKSGQVKNWYGYELTMNSGGVFSLPLASEVSGISFSFRNIKGESIIVRPQTEDAILIRGYQLGKELVLNSMGDYLKVQSLGGKHWLVLEANYSH